MRLLETQIVSELSVPGNKFGYRLTFKKKLINSQIGYMKTM